MQDGMIIYAKFLRATFDDLTTRIKKIEDSVAHLKERDVADKVRAIENAMGGEVEQLLSVALLGSEVKNLKETKAEDVLRLEKLIEALDERLNFFVTITITLSLGIFAAIVAPLVLPFFQRRRGPQSTSREPPNTTLQRTGGDAGR